MPAIITNSFKIKNAKDFISRAGTDVLYATIGRAQTWSPNDSTVPTPTNAPSELVVDTWKEAIASKKILPGDVAHVIPRYDWVSGDTGYVAYNPADQLLLTKKFFTVVNDAGTYKIYKCIVKGAGAVGASGGVAPTHTSTAILPASGGDGYRWKFMYSIPVADYIKFATLTHVPIGLTASNAFTTPGTGLAPYPPGGHGANNIEELGGYFVSINVRFEYSEGGILPTTNEFRKISLVSSPLIANGTPGVFESGNPVSGTLATGNVYNNCTVLTINEANTNFAQDGTLTISGAATGTARIVYYDSVAKKVYVQMISGSVAATCAVTDGSIAGTVASVAYTGLQWYSGNTIYLEYRAPITRSGDQTEALTTVIEF